MKRFRPLEHAQETKKNWHENAQQKPDQATDVTTAGTTITAAALSDTLRQRNAAQRLQSHDVLHQQPTGSFSANSSDGGNKWGEAASVAILNRLATEQVSDVAERAKRPPNMPKVRAKDDLNRISASALCVLTRC